MLAEPGSRGAGPATTALLLLDLDGFKNVNDTLGHAAGDRLLVEVAAAARAWQRWAQVQRYDAPEAWVRQVAWRLAVSRFRRACRGAGLVRRSGPPADVPALSPDRVALVAALRRLPDARPTGRQRAPSARPASRRPRRLPPRPRRLPLREAVQRCPVADLGYGERTVRVVRQAPFLVETAFRADGESRAQPFRSYGGVAVVGDLIATWALGDPPGVERAQAAQAARLVRAALCRAGSCC